MMFSSSPEETQADRLERSSSISEDYVRYLNNPQHTEKRFPVDRKKLERLIIGEWWRVVWVKGEGVEGEWGRMRDVWRVEDL